MWKPTFEELNNIASYYTVTTVGDTQTKNNIGTDNIVNFLKVFCTVPKGKRTTVIMGGNKLPYESELLDEDVVTTDCGVILIEGTHNNGLDYNGTTIEIFLPFVGVETLETVKCMNHSLHLTYKTNIISGKCVAILTNENEDIMFSFDGNMSFSIPLDSNTKTFSDSDYMLGFTPYVIIRSSVEYAKPYTNKNKTRATIGSFKGFNTFTDFNLNTIDCTDDEKEEIKNLLEGGVIL